MIMLLKIVLQFSLLITSIGGGKGTNLYNVGGNGGSGGGKSGNGTARDRV